MGRKKLQIDPTIMNKIIEDLKNGLAQWKIAEKYNIKPNHISKIWKTIKGCNK